MQMISPLASIINTTTKLTSNNNYMSKNNQRSSVV